MKKHTAKINTTIEKQCSLPFDRISELPNNILQMISMFLPLRDMARTSILSKHWRYQWVKVPELVFEDDPKYAVSQEVRYRYTAEKVFKILLLHHGPILRFTLDMTSWQNFSDIDSIIPFLSRNGIKELTLLIPNKRESYTLPTSIFSCAELRRLSLSSCVFEPLTLVGFSKLVSLELLNVTLDSDVSISSCPFLESLVLQGILTIVNLFSIDAPNLNKLHIEGTMTRIGTMNTPLLKVLWLITADDCYTGNSSFDLVSFLYASSLLEDLHVCYSFLRVLAQGDSSNKLPKYLNNLRKLELFDVELSDLSELSPSLWFIRSSPNLQKLKLTVGGAPQSSTESELYLKMQEHSNYSLLKLQEVEMTISDASHDLSLVIVFSKFLLDISPVLGTMYIEPDFEVIDLNGYKMLVELACYPRVSPKAKIVYVGLESLNLPIV